MKIAWMSAWDRWGNGKGYTVHNENMRKHTAKIPGVEVVDNPFEANIVMDVVVPPGFQPVKGKFNVMFTMYEMGTVPEIWIPHIREADLVIVPCEHNGHLFRRYTDAPVEVCPEGINPEHFKPHVRVFPPAHKHFNFLWVGASNPRKGFEIVCAAWEVWIKTQPQHIIDRSRMIMKTTTEDGRENVEILFNMIFDRRHLPFDELLNLYYNCHAFVLPSMGEGWALTLCEAAATGMPCVYTPWSGPVDFMKREWSYPAKFEMKTLRAVKHDEKLNKKIIHEGPAALADPVHVARRMEQIYHGYSQAVERGIKQARHIRQHFTWDKAAERLVQILEKHTGEKRDAA